MRTIAAPVEGPDVRVEPTEEPGIRVNGTPADLAHVVKADVRVDLAAHTRSFVVEHVLGPLGLRGVTAANVVGVRDEWEFARPEHRFCYAVDLAPSNVVGHPAGLPNPTIAKRLGEVDIVETKPTPRTTVREPVRYEANDGDLVVRPREYGAGARFDVTYGDASLVVDVDPTGETADDLVRKVCSSTTPYLSPTDEVAVTHSIADLVSDLLVIGGFDDVAVEADLGDAYHALTVGAAREASERGVVVDRTA